MKKRNKKLLTYFMSAVLAGCGLVSSLNVGQVKAAGMYGYDVPGYDVFIGNSKRYTVGCAEDWRIVLEAPADEFKSVGVDGEAAPAEAVKSVKAVGYPEGFEPEVPATSEAPAASEAPATSEAPAATSEAPAATTEAPAATTEAPAATTEAPATTTEAPAPSTTEAPWYTTEAPAATTEAPAPSTTEAPAVSEAPAATSEAPAATTEAPAVSEAPATTETPYISEAPMATGYSYVSSNAAAVYAASAEIPATGNSSESEYKCTEIILDSSWVDTIGIGKHMVTLVFENGKAYVGIVVTGSTESTTAGSTESTTAGSTESTTTGSTENTTAGSTESTTASSTENTTAASDDYDDTDSDNAYSADSINVDQKTDANGIVIQKFSFKNAALPADTVWMVGNMSDDEIIMLNNNGINAKFGWDINPYSGGVRAQVAPGYKVNVQFALPSDFAFNSMAEYKIYDLTYNVYQDVVINNGILSFDASHFSKYALVEMASGTGSVSGNVTDNATDSTASADAQVTSPKTADTTGVVFWALCMAAAIGAFVVTFAKGRQYK